MAILISWDLVWFALVIVPFLSAVISFIISPASLPTTTLQSFLDNQSKQQRE